MNTDFPRIIALQRKERQISQKQAAADLGISQALLSHYEKGIRECGLDFLVKGAESLGAAKCARSAFVIAAVRALALYLDPDNAEMFSEKKENS